MSKNQIHMTLEESRLCLNCDTIYNGVGCPLCGSYNVINLINHFEKNSGALDKIEERPPVSFVVTGTSKKISPVVAAGLLQLSQP